MLNMLNKYEQPELNKRAYTCPDCSAFSKQDWHYIMVNESVGDFIEYIPTTIKSKIKYLYICKCENCGYISFWYDKKLIWPLNTGIEPPLEEMPDDIKDLYNEARNIIELSPKGACAILRLALQKICNRLANQDEKKKIDGAIKILVEKGLSKQIQQAMDTIRIVGDEAVHPGEINLDDNKDIAVAMFRLLNIVIDRILIEPKEIEDLYNLMPKNKLDGINNRDKNKE